MLSHAELAGEELPVPVIDPTELIEASGEVVSD